MVVAHAPSGCHGEAPFEDMAGQFGALGGLGVWVDGGEFGGQGFTSKPPGLEVLVIES
jgi:hypothetical protein